MKHTSASSNTLADQLAAHFKKFDYGHLTEATKKSVKRLLLDYLGVAISGSQSESGRLPVSLLLSPADMPSQR